MSVGKRGRRWEVVPDGGYLAGVENQVQRMKLGCPQPLPMYFLAARLFI